MKKLLAGIIFVVVAFLGGMALAGVLGSGGIFSQTTESEDSQIIQAVERQQKVGLLSLSIQGIADSKTKSQILGLDVPGSERALFLQYKYTAQLGLDGAKVSVKKTGENSYRVTVPEFEYLGNSDVSFKKAIEQNGAISMVTPEIDVSKLVNKVLNPDTKKQTIKENKTLLKDQCRNFYDGLITAIDPEAKTEYVFK